MLSETVQYMQGRIFEVLHFFTGLAFFDNFLHRNLVLFVSQTEFIYLFINFLFDKAKSVNFLRRQNGFPQIFSAPKNEKRKISYSFLFSFACGTSSI